VSASTTIIVNADDLGLHPAVRRAVEACAARGTLTSASVLANGPDLGEVRPIRGVSLGAHLNVLRGTPVSPAREVRSLVDAGGLFVGSWAKFALRVARGSIDRDELRLEWSRQVAVLRDRGLALSHLDGEKHTHCFPTLFPVACEVAEEHGIRFVRRSSERFGNFHTGTAALRRALLVAMDGRARVPAGAAGVRTNDLAWGIAEQGRALTPEALVSAMSRATGALDGAVVEIVSHPGDRHRGDPELPASFGRMRVDLLWEPELRSLLERPWRETIAAQGWRLASFDELAEAP
jgi:predicted glycoside hydrolase/deacetylase ChbG (UPF0249 family)